MHTLPPKPATGTSKHIWWPPFSSYTEPSFYRRKLSFFTTSTNTSKHILSANLSKYL